MEPIKLDGRTGEGGGQLVRVAIGLAALTTQPVTISHVRGNREGPRGGGLKSQHVTSIQWLAEATDAVVEGLSVGSHTITFTPRRPPSQLLQRNIKIAAESGSASTLLILQAIFPFLLFAGNESREPIEVEISGGTNVHYSLSFEYLDQILLPVLSERFGIDMERKLLRRGWSLGPQSRGSIRIKLQPLGLGERLRFKAPAGDCKPSDSDAVVSVDASLIAPRHAWEELQAILAKDIGALFPGANLRLRITEDSGTDKRWYILLVANSASGNRWGKDVLSSTPKKTKSKATFVRDLSRKLCRELFDQVSSGDIDEHLQDQLVCFQAICDGYSSFPRGGLAERLSSVALSVDALGELDGDQLKAHSRMRKEKTHEPFGGGSLHTRTARWVAAELLPMMEVYNKGDVVKGAGVYMSSSEND